MKWIALFSQTGSEIVDLSKKLNRAPDCILTNNLANPTGSVSINPGIWKLKATVIQGKHDLLMTFLENLPLTDVLITLHGYLRILPEHICERFSILNGHPGLITVYEELKGKDPQKRAWDGKYPLIGSVVHKVTPIVDDGEVISSVCYTNRCETIDELYGKLKQASLESWIWALSQRKEQGCVLE